MTRILLVDDTAADLVAIGDFLEDEGFAVDRAETAEEALRLAASAEALVVDVVLEPGFESDQMQRREGIEVVGKLLERGAIDPGTPIIFISKLDHEEPTCQASLKESGIQEDRFRWLRKPIDLDLLEDLLRDGLAASAQGA